MIRAVGVVLILSVCGCVYKAAPPEKVAAPVDLRGYGRTSAEFGKGRALFHCQDAEHADILLGKLTADLLWDVKDTCRTVAVDVAGKSIPAMACQPYGVMVLGAAENDVFAWGAPDANSLKSLLADESVLARGTVHFKPAKPYPVYLDFYDLKAFKSYVHAATSTHGEGLASHWDFVRKMGLGGLASQDLGLIASNPMAGVVDFSRMDYEVREAERQEGLFVVCPQVGGELPLWMYNKDPYSDAKFSSSLLFQGWSHGSVGATYECDGGNGALPLSTLRLMMSRYVKSQSLGGWHLYRGQPIGDNVSLILDGCAWDHSSVAQAGLRQWLKETKGYDLAALGKRWFGDPKHFRSWDDVRVPDVAAIVGGGYDPDRFLIPDAIWKWRKAEAKEYGQPPTETGSPWVTVQRPPSQQMAFLPSGSAYFKVTFNAVEWLKAHAGRPLKLGCTVNLYDNNKLLFWLNGHAFESPPAKASGVVPLVAEIPAGALNAQGDNELIIQTPDGRSDGRVCGPVFLSDKPRQLFPFDDTRLNARREDALEFQRHSIFVRQQEMFKEARRLDPNRPMIISGEFWEDIGSYTSLAVKEGLGMQYTARDGFYNPWNPALGNIVGFYATSEPSGTMATPDVFNRTLGYMLYDGDSSCDLFWDVEDYIGLDRKFEMLSSKRRLIQLFGKSLREQPQILLLRSALSLRASSPEPWNWDIGRGTLQSAHFDYGYVSEREVKSGAVKPYPVIFDAGSDMMDAETVAALSRYVEAGGTFIALHNTGRSTPLEANAWPVSKLTGFNVTACGKQGVLCFSNELPVLKGWEGRQFKDDGHNVDWTNGRPRATGIALSPAASGTQALARWDDGSVAVGLRQLGRGRVIVLGSSFWRDGKDAKGQWVPDGTRVFFDSLFAELGVSKEADASSGKIWVRKTTTKNGLQDWLIAFNMNERPDAAVTSDLSFKVCRTPESVRDLLSGKPVEFKTRPGGWVDIPAVTFGKYDTRIFAVQRADTVTDALPVWWAEKLKYWRRSSGEHYDAATPPDASAKVLEALPFDQWSFKAVPDGTVATNGAWAKPGFDAKVWKAMPSGSWKLMDAELKDYNGIGLYRREFTVPDTWKGHVITLNLLDHAACDKGVFSVNGVKVYEFRESSFNRERAPFLSFDISGLLTFEGANTLSVSVEGGKELAGICGAVWLAPERVLAPSLDLNGTWCCVMKDFVTAKEVSVPGKMFGRYLRREVDIPAAWAGKSVFLHMETDGNWCGCVMVNGSPKSQAADLTPFGTRVEINLTPFIKPGQRNLVELWPRHTIPTNWRALGYHWPDETDMEVKAVSIGCEVK